MIWVRPASFPRTCCVSMRWWRTGNGARWSGRAATSPGCARPGGTADGVFSCLIGGPGVYAVTPEEPRFVWGGYYEGGTLIWRSRWITSSGFTECREALACPGDPHTAVVLRRVVALDGPARVRVVLDVRAGFGRYRMSQLKQADGVWTARSGPLRMRWSGGGDATVRADGALELHLTLDPGAFHDLVLEISDQTLPRVPVQAPEAWLATETSWAAAVPELGPSLAAEDSRHSYAVLAGLTSSSGGMVAAATMSLPERSKAGRNYDYRYVWIRDQCYAGQAVAADGPHRLLDDAVSFVAERILADGPDLKPAYTVACGPVPGEESLSRLSGYPGGADKVGNWVNRQFQLDSLGEALQLFAAAAGHDHLDTLHWQAAEVAVKAIETRWRDPDAGVWELGNRRWAHSRLMCVAGLRAIAAAGTPPGQAAAWQTLADAILADVAGGQPARQRAVAARSRRRSRGRRPAAARDPRGRARDRPAQPGYPRRDRGRPVQRGLPLPLPARPAPAAGSRGRVRALRIPHGAGHASAGPDQ